MGRFGPVIISGPLADMVQSPDEKVKVCAVSALARRSRLNYRDTMTGFARNLLVFLIAIFVAGTLAVSAAPLEAEASSPMVSMAMTSGAQDCVKCDPKMDMMASCDLTCALSTVGVLAGHVAPASVLVTCRFDLVDATADGRAPPPPFTPPRTIILI